MSSNSRSPADPAEPAEGRQDAVLSLRPDRRTVIAGGLMAATAMGAFGLTAPETNSASAPELDRRVPESFAGWSLLPETTPLLPDEETQATIRQIYDETLARTYTNGSGDRVMLVMAYGSRQSDSLRAHQPEVCYAAQGFEVSPRATAVLSEAAPIEGTRMYATQGARTEPIVYWIAVDGKVTGFTLALKWQQIKASFERRVPEGFLVRASLIGPDTEVSYDTLDAFLTDLLAAVSPDIRRRLSGL